MPSCASCWHSSGNSSSPLLALHLLGQQQLLTKTTARVWVEAAKAAAVTQSCAQASIHVLQPCRLYQEDGSGGSSGGGGGSI